jgi:prepilin peptidase CpaA
MTALLFAHLVVLALFMGLLLAAAMGDVKTYRIPNAYSLALLALYPFFALTTPQSVSPFLSLGVMAAVFALGFTIYAFNAIGGGDVKLLTVAALFAGPRFAVEFLAVTALAGGLVATLMLHRPMRAALAVAFDSIGNRTLRDALLTDIIPYGVAIAAGGVYLTLRLVGFAADAA